MNNLGVHWHFSFNGKINIYNAYISGITQSKFLKTQFSINLCEEGYLNHSFTLLPMHCVRK